MISGNMVGSYNQIGKTFILVDEVGNELTGVVTDNIQVFDATPVDVKIGKTFVSDSGAGVGKDTKTYRVTKASQIILPNTSYSILLGDYNQYDYTQFQCLITKFNTSFADSVCTDKISIGDNVYGVNSTEVISSVTKNKNTQSIDLNITNDTTDIYVIHYFTYKEEY